MFSGDDAKVSCECAMTQMVSGKEFDRQTRLYNTLTKWDFVIN